MDNIKTIYNVQLADLFALRVGLAKYGKMFSEQVICYVVLGVIFPAVVDFCICAGR